MLVFMTSTTSFSDGSDVSVEADFSSHNDEGVVRDGSDGMLLPRCGRIGVNATVLSEFQSQMPNAVTALPLIRTMRG